MGLRMDVPPPVGRMRSTGGQRLTRMAAAALPDPDPAAESQLLHKYLPNWFLNKPEMLESLKSTFQTAPVLLSPALGSPAARPGSLQAPAPCPDPLILEKMKAGRQAPAWSGSQAGSNTSASYFIRDIQAG